MKSKVFARVLCVVLCLVLVGSALLIAIPLIKGEAATPTPVAGGTGYINDSGVNLRSGPGTNYSIVTTMTKNTKFTFISAKLYNTEWYNIKLNNGKKGYVHKYFVVVDTPIVMCRSALLTYVGTKYAFWVTGATSPTWKSSNTSLATIDSNGVMTAKAAGKITITATSGGRSATCNVTLKKGSSTGVNYTKVTMTKGTTFTLKAKVANVSWYSSNTNVATVSNGKVTAKAVGYATISAYDSSGSSTCLIQVVEKSQSSSTASKIKICRTSLTTYVGTKYAFWQTGASKPSWTSSKTSVATIDSNGIMTAKTAGTTTITVKEGSSSASCKVTLKKGTSTGITYASTGVTMTKGTTFTLKAKASDVGWFSSNTNVATVSGGKVTAKNVGYATISAYNSRGSSTCLIKVKEPAATSSATGYINTDGVNLRSGPGTNYSVLTIMGKSTTFTFITETLYNSSWYYIKLSDGTKGYVMKDYATKNKPLTIKMCRKTATIYKGCQYALWQTGADYPEWKSSNTSIATVDGNGIVTAKSTGKVTITASQDGGSASCVFTIKSGVSTGISNSSSGIVMTNGTTYKFNAKVSNVSWFSSNTNVATVKGGTVAAKGVGYTTISAYNTSGSSTCLVKVNPGNGTIKFAKSSVAIYKGCQYAIPVSGTTSAYWKSSNTSVATVNGNGVVTSKGVGTTTVKAWNSKSSATIKITVKSGSSTGITATSANVPKGKSIILKANSGVSWTSSNSSIATVKNGVVDTKKTGYVTIHAYTSSGSSTCLIHVTSAEPVRFVYASPNSAPLKSKVTFKAITDKTRTGVKFVANNGSHSLTLTAKNKTTDGNNYIWTASYNLNYSGKWTIKAYSKTASSDYTYKSGNGDGEVFVTTATNTTTTVTGERRASDSIINLIATFEGFLPSVTADYITTDPTLGYGKVVTTNEQFYNNLTKSEAYAYLCQTVNSGGYTTVTNKYLTSNNIKFNQRQFDALVCFTYNVGAYVLYNDSILSNILLNCGSAPKIAAGVAGYINESGVNLRSGPGTNYSILTSMSKNTKFTFVDNKTYNSHWYKIKLTSTGKVGYVYSDYATVSGSGTRDFDKVNKNSLIKRFLQYHHAAGSCYWGLLYRRIDEMEIFFYGDYICDGEKNKYHFNFTCANNSSFRIS